MIPKNFRSKYSLEQYTIMFEFEKTLSGFPLIEVELVNGLVDPSDEQNLGVSLTLQGSKFVLATVAGGIPGNVYTISCTVDSTDGDTLKQSGVISILYSNAVMPPLPGDVEVPPGEQTPPPFSKFYQSPLYPVIYTDQYIFNLAPVGGFLRPAVIDCEIETSENVLSFVPLLGILQIPPPATIDPDGKDFYFIPINGRLLTSKSGKYFDKNDYQFIPTGGKLKTPPVGDIDPDFKSLAFVPTGGGLI